jgi:hypothetical protein
MVSMVLIDFQNHDQVGYYLEDRAVKTHIEICREGNIPDLVVLFRILAFVFLLFDLIHSSIGVQTVASSSAVKPNLT